MNKPRKPASESLRALHEFLLEPEEDVRAVPLEKIKAELKREGIDTDPLVRDIRKRLARARGAEMLQKARTERAGLLSKLAATSATMAEAVKRTRDETIARISELLQRQPAHAGVYFRKLEHATDEDLERLLKDLETTEALDEGDEPPQRS